MITINKDELAKFLDEANKSTYANKDTPKVAPTRLESEDYHFEKDDLIYHDTYFGGHDFIGEEVVYKSKNPVWGANYFGFVFDKHASEKDVYDFLRKALMQEYDDVIPVRGPTKFSDGEWKYTFLVEGDLENFAGKEEISLNDKIVYRCLVHGGLIR